MRIQATAVLTRCSGGDELRPYSLSIRDAVAGVEFVELHMTAEQLAFILTAHVTPEVECEVRGLSIVGTRMEVKEEVVLFNPYKRERDDEAHQRAALAPFEVDGWRGRSSDLTNGHRATKQGLAHAQRVTFTRNVPMEVIE